MIGALPFSRAKELGQDLMRRISEGGLNEDVLGPWVGADPDRTNFLAWTAWGTIRWDKSLGRPEGTKLSAGFTITHKAKRVGWQCAGCPEATDWLDQADVAIFDLPMDGDAYVVGYNCHSTYPADTKGWMLYDGGNTVNVRFTPGHLWVSENVPLTDIPVHLWLQPTGWYWKATQERVFFEPIEVR